MFKIRIKKIEEEQEKDLRRAAEEMGSLEDNTDRLIELAKKGDVVLKNKSRQEADKCKEVFKRFNLSVEIEDYQLGEEERPEKRPILKPTIMTFAVLGILAMLVFLVIGLTRSQSVSDFLEEWEQIVEKGDCEGFQKISFESFRESKAYETIWKHIANSRVSLEDEDGVKRVRLNDDDYIVKYIPFNLSNETYYKNLHLEKQGRKWKISELYDSFPSEGKAKKEQVEKEEKQRKQEVEPKKEVQKEEQEEKRAVDSEAEEKPSFQSLEIKPRPKMKELEIKPKKP